MHVHACDTDTYLILISIFRIYGFLLYHVHMYIYKCVPVRGAIPVPTNYNKAVSCNTYGSHAYFCLIRYNY